MLKMTDVFLSLLHFLIIGFNLFGWIWRYTRKAHFICILATAASWFLLGLWFGIGYCPITDWEWQVKMKLGEHDLPASFVKYYADKLSGENISSSVIDTITVVSFAVAAILSVYMNFIRKKDKSLLR